jgi:hypothetical protein
MSCNSEIKWWNSNVYILGRIWCNLFEIWMKIGWVMVEKVSL